MVWSDPPSNDFHLLYIMSWYTSLMLLVFSVVGNSMGQVFLFHIWKPTRLYWENIESNLWDYVILPDTIMYKLFQHTFNVSPVVHWLKEIIYSRQLSVRYIFCSTIVEFRSNNQLKYFPLPTLVRITLNFKDKSCLHGGKKWFVTKISPTIVLNIPI